jgi:hypothetical protein
MEAQSMPELRHNYLNLVIPDGWEDASQVIALGPEDDGFRPNLVFSQEPTKPGESAAEFAYRQLPELRKALTNYYLVWEGEATFGSNFGFLREHTFSMEKGEFGQLQFYVVINDRAYNFQFTHLRENMADARVMAESLFTKAELLLPAHEPLTPIERQRRSSDQTE